MRLARIVLLVLLMGVEAAQARPGLGGSFGSRGSRSFMPPARTATTPFGAAPLRAARPAWSQPAASMGLNRGRFSSGFVGGLLGAGLFGILVGHGMFGGMHGFGGMLGLLLQLGLLFLVVRWLMRTWAGRPAMAGGGGAAPFGAQSFAGPPRAAAPFGGAGRGPNVALAQSDYAAFENILQEVQNAWTRGDGGALARVTTPEMAATFRNQQADLARRGLRNATSAVRFEGGDLAESWREGMSLFATVAVRYSMIDVTTDGSGRLVDGSATERVTAREYWTFVRGAVGGWRLSAIQQA